MRARVIETEDELRHLQDGLNQSRAAMHLSQLLFCLYNAYKP